MTDVPGRAARLAAAGVAVAALLALGAVVVHDHGNDGQPVRVASCVPPAPGSHRIAVEAGRAPVSLHVPPGPARAGRPLIVVLPGAGQSGADIARSTGYSALADRRGFLAAYPTATGRRPFWNVSGRQPGKPDDVAYLRRAITTLTAVACADPARVGMTGVSNGGGMTARMACDAADLLAAAAPVAGGYSTLPACRPRRPLPILEIHGLEDQVVPYDGRGVDHAGAVVPWLRGWLTRDACRTPARRSTPAPRVQELRWRCPEHRDVVHDRVLDAQHGWPGEASLQPFSSTLRTWRFLSGYRRED
jgi:polyhydroxybutyrate depolymerase